MELLVLLMSATLGRSGAARGNQVSQTEHSSALSVVRVSPSSGAETNDATRRVQGLPIGSTSRATKALLR